MPDRAITDFPLLATVADNDVLVVVDVSDTTESPEGTTKKVRRDELKRIDAGDINTTKLADSAVTTPKLADAAVTTAKLNDSAVTAAKIADGDVTTAKLADSAVATAKLADGSVSSTKLASSAVATAAIQDSAVTTAKINNAAVTTVKVADGAITNAKLNDGAVTPAKMSGAQSGSAPIYSARAWAFFDGTSTNNASGTYSRTGTTVTVSITNHGLSVGHVASLDFTTGTAADGVFTVTSVADANTFTVEHGTSGSTIGNVTMLRAALSASGNIASIAKVAAGHYHVNFAVAMPDANFAVTATAGNHASTVPIPIINASAYDTRVAPTANGFRLYVTNYAGSSGYDSTDVAFQVFR